MREVGDTAYRCSSASFPSFSASPFSTSTRFISLDRTEPLLADSWASPVPPSFGRARPTAEVETEDGKEDVGEDDEEEDGERRECPDKDWGKLRPCRLGLGQEADLVCLEM